MPKVLYKKWNPKPEALEAIQWVNEVCESYAAQGYDLTLRQLFYAGVSRGYIPNTEQSYKRLGDIIDRGRLAGLIDWEHIVDRTRELEEVSHWDSPGDVLRSAARAFALDKWAKQQTRVEVWVEKQALAGIIEQPARRSDVAWFACRGYVSQSEMWKAAQRYQEYIEAGQNVIVLHLGDHDPSGMDMTRDIEDRIYRFLTQDFYDNNGDEVREHAGKDSGINRGDIWACMRDRLGDRVPFEIDRIALNWDQIQEYDPPPNPARATDARYRAYRERFGDQSWELDALDPATLDALVTQAIDEVMDLDAFTEEQDREEEERKMLTAAATRWSDVKSFLAQEA